MRILLSMGSAILVAVVQLSRGLQPNCLIWVFQNLSHLAGSKPLKFLNKNLNSHDQAGWQGQLAA